MTLKIARTPDGIVVREIQPSGERAYRQAPNGSWAFCADHKGPWIAIARDHVPNRIITALREAAQ